jgi:alkylmercury lyase
MDRPTLEDAVRAWSSTYEGLSQEEIDRRLRMLTQVVRALAEGRPLTPARLAEATGVPFDAVQRLVPSLERTGLEFDAERNLLGAALTLRPTPHRLRLRGREFHAWCSLDTLFLPGLLDEPAEVESTCPLTRTPIRLHVTPEGVTDYAPPGAVSSVVLPGLSPTRDGTGPRSSVCSQMHFFATRPAAETWAKDHPGVAILSIEESFELARVHWIDRKRRAFCAGDAGWRDLGASGRAEA